MKVFHSICEVEISYVKLIFICQSFISYVKYMFLIPAFHIWNVEPIYFKKWIRYFIYKNVTISFVEWNFISENVHFDMFFTCKITYEIFVTAGWLGMTTWQILALAEILSSNYPLSKFSSGFARPVLFIVNKVFVRTNRTRPWWEQFPFEACCLVNCGRRWSAGR